MDIKVVVNRIMAYLIIIGLYALMGIILIIIYSYFLPFSVNIPTIMFMILLIIIAGLTFHPLRLLLQTTPDKFLFRKKYIYDQAIKELAQAATKKMNRDEVIDRFSRKIKEALKTKKADIFILQDDGKYEMTGGH